MGIVIPFPSPRPPKERPRVFRRRVPLGVLDVPPRGEVSLTFVPRNVTRIDRLLFLAAPARELLVLSMSIGDDDCLVGSVPLLLLRGAPMDLPAIAAGDTFTFTVQNVSRARVVMSVRAELFLLTAPVRA